MLLAFSLSMILCFIGFQYLREKQYKSDFLNAQLQMYNRNLLKVVEDGLSYEEYIAKNEKPFEDLRVSIISLSGAVIYDNMISLDSLDNHSHRPEIAAALNKGNGYHIGRQSTSDGREYFYSATKGKRAIIRTAIPYSSTLRELLKADGIDAAVVNIHTIKPIDKELILKYAAKTGKVVTAEEHTVIGGLGSAVSEVVTENVPVPVVKHGVYDEFGQSGPATELLKVYGLDAEHIAEKAKEAIALKK